MKIVDDQGAEDEVAALTPPVNEEAAESVPKVEVVRAQRTHDGAVLLWLQTDEDTIEYVYREDDPHRLRGLKDLHWPEVEDAPPPVDPKPIVPGSVTPAQAQIVLYEAGLLAPLEAKINAPDTYPPMRIWYNKAVAYERGSPYIQAMGYDLGLTDEAMDAMFIQAAMRTS